MHIHAMKNKSKREASTQDVIACLAVDSRFRLVRAIAGSDRCVGELAASVGLSQSCTTRHLQALERAGLVRGRREGRRVRFTLCADAPGAVDILGLVLGDPVGLAPPRPHAAGSSRAKPLPEEAIAAGPPPADARSSGAGPVDDGPARSPRSQELEDYLL